MMGKLFWITSGCLVGLSSSRTWEDIDTYHTQTPIDANIISELYEVDALWFTPFPTISPSHTPTMIPTALPTETPMPTDRPSVRPSMVPTNSPSLSPSVQPSFEPSSPAPTLQPSRDPYPENDPPDSIDFVYFNYDDSRTSTYGPGYPELVRHNSTLFKIQYKQNAWKTRRVPSDWYWREFDSEDNGGFGPWAGVLSRKDPGANECGNVGQQSPIDVVPNGAMCFEHHQIRSRRGDLSIQNGTEVKPLIEGNKLRLKYLRRPCRDYLLPECAEPDPPAADFPNNWGGYSDAMHIDFKVPAEHRMMGEEFDAEMQIFYLHPSRRRTPAVSVLMRVTRQGWNPMLQRVLDKFQAVFDSDKGRCAIRNRRERQLVSRFHKLVGEGVESEFDDYETWADYSTHFDDPNYEKYSRELQSGIWNPHDPQLVPSYYFFGYEGSLTEPPCSEWVSWFVIDTPMTINLVQLQQMKRLIFLHVSPDCQRTSVHYRESVARPIQDTFGRPIWRCTEAHYLPDDQRVDITN